MIMEENVEAVLDVGASRCFLNQFQLTKNAGNCYIIKRIHYNLSLILKDQSPTKTRGRKVAWYSPICKAK